MAFQLNKPKPKKLELMSKYTLTEPIEFCNIKNRTEKDKDTCINPIFNLLTIFEEFEFFLSKDYLTKLLYFNRKNAHKILYDEEEIITINSNEKSKSLNYLFYLVLLINDKNVINYQYSIKYIQDILELINEEKENFKILILTKILFELINNYKSSDEYKEDEEEDKLNKIIKFFEKNKWYYKRFK